METLWNVFRELLVVPFRHVDMVWGIVPLYFSWITAELTATKASPRTALQTGFTLLWAGANWTWQTLRERPEGLPPVSLDALLMVKSAVTLTVLALGLIAFVAGIRRRLPKTFRFLGHARFAGYFLITIFPMQSAFLPWTWARVAAVAAFAPLVWILVQGLTYPIRR